jgi:hypothetical protein
MHGPNPSVAPVYYGVGLVTTRKEVKGKIVLAHGTKAY